MKLESLVGSTTSAYDVTQDWTLDYSGTGVAQDKLTNTHKNLLTSSLLGARDKQNQQFAQATRLAGRLTRLLEMLPGGVVVLDGEGRIQQSNVAAIDFLGDSLEGQPWAAVIDNAFDPQVDDGHGVSLKDGRLLHISTSPLGDEPGQIVLLQDVTETQQLQKQVLHLQRLSAMGEMAARLAHQIRTPLASALLFLAPLLKEDTDKKIRQHFAQHLHESLSHMEQLVKDMLAFSRGDMNATAPIAITELLAGVKQQFQSLPAQQAIAFNIHNAVDNGTIYGCKEALTSAINNLLNNAYLACQAEGEITLLVDQVVDDKTTWIAISIQDNGCGIAEQDQDKVLLPFFTTRSSGTGLGLAVVQSIVKAHKGELSFTSIPGEGSTFCLRLPVYQSGDKFTLKQANKE